MFTYDDRLLTDLDRVRFALGDTTDTPEQPALLSDETIDAILLTDGSVAHAIVTLGAGLVTRIAYEPIKLTADGTSVDYSGRIPALNAAIGRAQAQVDTASGSGGTSISFVPRAGQTLVDEYGRVPRW